MNKWLLGLLVIGGGFALLVILGVSLVGLGIYNRRNNPDAQFNRLNIRGNQYFSSHQYRAAEADYTAMIALRPNRSEGYVMRGEVECQLKNFGQGIEDAEAGMRFAASPADRAGCYQQRGDCYRGMRQWHRAVADYNEAVKRGDEDFELYIGRATCYEELKQYKRAASDFATLVYSDPARAEFSWHYARNLVNSGNIVGAVDVYKTMTKRFPGDPDIWNTLCWHQYLANDLTAAIRSAKKALALNENTLYAGFNLALCYAVQGKAESARLEYIKACRGAPAAEIAAALGEIVTALKKRPGFAPLQAMQTLLQSRLAKTAKAKIIRRPAPETEATQ